MHISCVRYWFGDTFWWLIDNVSSAEGHADHITAPSTCPAPEIDIISWTSETNQLTRLSAISYFQHPDIPTDSYITKISYILTRAQLQLNIGDHYTNAHIHADI